MEGRVEGNIGVWYSNVNNNNELRNVHLKNGSSSMEAQRLSNNSLCFLVHWNRLYPRSQQHSIVKDAMHFVHATRPKASSSTMPISIDGRQMIRLCTRDVHLQSHPVPFHTALFPLPLLTCTECGIQASFASPSSAMLKAALILQAVDA